MGITIAYIYVIATLLNLIFLLGTFKETFRVTLKNKAIGGKNINYFIIFLRIVIHSIVLTFVPIINVIALLLFIKFGTVNVLTGRNIGR